MANDMDVFIAIIGMTYVTMILLLLTLLTWPYDATARRVCSMTLMCTEKLHKDASPFTSRPQSIAAWEWHNAADLYTSSTLPSASGYCLVLGLRFLLLCYFIFGLFFQGAAPPSLSYGLRPSFLFYFANWAFMGVGVLATIGLAVSARAIFRTTLKRQEGDHQEGQPPSAALPSDFVPYDSLSKVYAVCATTVPVCVLMSSIVYWVILSHELEFRWSESIKREAGAFVLFLEAAGSRVPLTSSWMMFPAIFGYLYVTYMWLHGGIFDDWIYENKPQSGAVHVLWLRYLSLPFLLLLCFAIWGCWIQARTLVSRAIHSRPGSWSSRMSHPLEATRHPRSATRA